MTSITRDLRKDLEKTVKQARRIAEAGARQAVQQLRVGDGDAPKDLTTDQRALRTRLRAHGRQLGDRRDAKTGAQETAHLVQECAYEHWHRMLFARFLAETDLLIEPGSGMAITLDEVQELAREKATDWLPLASDYAERMLPQIFRKHDPVLEIALPPETRSDMEDLLGSLAKQVFEADDSLGWVYQFWQSDKKDEVNKSEVKIGADELPAVTQLFTEDYMVLFLLHNTLGSWWAGKVLAGNPAIAASAPDEAALRAVCKVGDVDWTYLRFVRDIAENGTDGPWRPAAGAFEGWPRAAKDLTVLDPCMGSGHFLVFALPILVAFRMAEEGMSQSAAVDAALKDNLFGLEIEPRCTQIAAFNLAFAAWRKVGHRLLPQLNLACSGLAIGVTKAEWLKLAEKAVTAADPAAKRDLLGVEENLLTTGLEERVKNGLKALYDLFAKAPLLGSLIDPRNESEDLFRDSFDKLAPLLRSILAASDNDETREMAVAAQGMAKAAEIVSAQYTLVATNFPFLGLEKQSPELGDYLKEYFEIAKRELATCFLVRSSHWCGSAGTTAVVMPGEWTYARPNRHFRKWLLSVCELDILCMLGSDAFATPLRVKPVLAVARWSSTTSLASVLDLRNKRFDEKASACADEVIQNIDQKIWKEVPDSRLVSGDDFANAEERLADYADAKLGVGAGDGPRFEKVFWELPGINADWSPLLGPSPDNREYFGRHSVIFWQQERGDIFKLAQSVKHLNHAAQNWQRGRPFWGRQGLLLSQMGGFTLYTGEIFDGSCLVIMPRDQSSLLAIAAYALSGELKDAISTYDDVFRIASPQSVLSAPFDLTYWNAIAAQKYPDGLPKPSSSDPTQWLFDGRPNGSDQPLQVAVARLLGYKWPRQTGADFTDCDALTPDCLEALADGDGIVCLTATKGEPPAHERLVAILKESFGAEWSAAKLAGLLAGVGYAGKSLDEWLRDGFFVQHCDLFHHRPFIWHLWDGRRDGFHALINYHCLAAPKGEGRRTLEKLVYSYLGDWIDRQRADQKSGLEGADARLAHAEHLKAELIKILEGEPPYDIFVRWKPLRTQSIGWDPDINDGVRVNIRPFINTTLLGGKKSACILKVRPRGKEFEYGKDRGKEPMGEKMDYPWFWGWDEVTSDFTGNAEFDGHRWNDLHYSRAVKQTARDGESAGDKA